MAFDGFLPVISDSEMFEFTLVSCSILDSSVVRGRPVFPYRIFCQELTQNLWIPRGGSIAQL